MTQRKEKVTTHPPAVAIAAAAGAVSRARKELERRRKVVGKRREALADAVLAEKGAEEALRGVTADFARIAEEIGGTPLPARSAVAPAVGPDDGLPDGPSGGSVADQLKHAGLFRGDD